MTSLPVLTVEVAWPNQPGDTTLTWTDITAYVDLPGGLPSRLVEPMNWAWSRRRG